MPWCFRSTPMWWRWRIWRQSSAPGWQVLRIQV